MKFVDEFRDGELAKAARRCYRAPRRTRPHATT